MKKMQYDIKLLCVIREIRLTEDRWLNLFIHNDP